jgi:thiol-disulfide isomerase/thioredoxin
VQNKIMMFLLCIFFICITETKNNKKEILIPDITKHNDKLLVVIASSCDICKKTKKTLQKTSVPIIYCNLNTCSQTFLAKYNIVGVPTFLYIKNGTVVHKDVGMEDKSTLYDKVDKLYKKYIKNYSSSLFSCS